MAKKTQIITDKPKEEKASKPKKKASSTKKSTQKNVQNDNFYSMIEKRAYELYLERGCSHGLHDQDWFKAEKEVMKNVDMR